jgi:glycosyltransferase involved in cell wall biosynthesis
MPQRLKVLISAYACEPGKGSEPEVGWQWALQMARFHDVTVLTRANNRTAIEEGLQKLQGQQPVPQFVYHDLNSFFVNAKRRFKLIKLYYVRWQTSARRVVARLHVANRFGLLHHVTFAAYRYPTAIWGHGVPSIWGPIGGAESIPAPLLPRDLPTSFFTESARNFSNTLQTSRYSMLTRRARDSSLILATTIEMQRTLNRLGFSSEIMPTIGLKTQELPYQAHRQSDGPLRSLYVGNVIGLKGIDLAVEALKKSEADATLTIVGDGNYLGVLKKQVENLGVSSRIIFKGRLPREQVLRLYPDYDVFVFPSLHDTGGYAVIEAMFNELPVICLDCGGPAVAVREKCGIKVPLDSRDKVVADLALAIRLYSRYRAPLLADGKEARRVVLEHYDWDKKGEEMNVCYLKATARKK